MEAYAGQVSKKYAPRPVVHVWLELVSRDRKTHVVHISEHDLAEHVADSVRVGDWVVAAGDVRQEVGPGGKRDVLTAHHVGLDMVVSNTMVIDGKPRNQYLHPDLHIGDVEDGQGVLLN